jgi:hypothetical protein
MLEVKIIRAVDLTSKPGRFSYVKFVVGNLEIKSNNSFTSGKQPYWSNEIIKFPLSKTDMKSEEIFSLSMYDNLNQFLGESHIDRLTILNWIACSRYEGRIYLDNKLGFLQVVIKVVSPRYLSSVSKILPNPISNDKESCNDPNNDYPKFFKETPNLEKVAYY